MKDFQITLTNRLKQLHNESEYSEISDPNKSLVNIPNPTVIDVASKQIKDSENPIGNKIKQLTDKRKTMKRDINARTCTEFTELCKAISKKVRENTRLRNMKMIEDIITNDRSLHKTAQKFLLGKSSIISINDKDGNKISNQEAILNRIKEFYENLYISNKPVEEIKQVTVSDAIPNIMKEKVKNAIKVMRKNKASGSDSIEIHIIKAAGEPFKNRDS